MLNRLGFVGLILLLAGSFAVTTASAADRERVTQFDVHVGDAFMLSIGTPAVDIAEAPNGDTIELIFTGQIDVKGHEAEGSGGFRHLDKKGNPVDFGTFTAKRLMSFVDYGPAAGGPPTFHRGRAQIKVRAVGQMGSFNAIMFVDCKFGPAPPPPPEFEEGTFFRIEGGLDFHENANEVNIFNLFVAVTDKERH